MQARTKGGEHNLPIFQPGAQGARSISQKHSLCKDQTGFELISGLGHREAVHQDNRIGHLGLVEEKSVHCANEFRQSQFADSSFL